jgi:hypothetical protein
MGPRQRGNWRRNHNRSQQQKQPFKLKRKGRKDFLQNAAAGDFSKDKYGFGFARSDAFKHDRQSIRSFSQRIKSSTKTAANSKILSDNRPFGVER